MEIDEKGANLNRMFTPNKLVRENKACTVKETLTLALCPTLNTVPDP